MGNPLESLLKDSGSALTAARRKEVATLHRKRHRERLGQFLLEGARTVEAALDGNAELTEIFLSRDCGAETDLVRRLSASGVVVHELTRKLERLFADTENPQGIIAVARIPDPAPVVIAEASRILVLDGVQDPGNVGTLIRTAAWFGVDAVASMPGTADFFGPKVVRATMGGLWDVPLVRTSSLADVVSTSGRTDWTIWGADLDGVPVRDWRPKSPSMLVIGSEAHGLSEDVRDALTGRVSIPAAGAVRAAESLNASVAGGILMQAWAG